MILEYIHTVYVAGKFLNESFCDIIAKVIATLWCLYCIKYNDGHYICFFQYVWAFFSGVHTLYKIDETTIVAANPMWPHCVM